MVCQLAPAQEARMYEILRGIADDPHALEMQQFIQHGTVTTYDDPGYVSVEVYGQTVTLAVPESAQAYLPYLAYVQ